VPHGALKPCFSHSLLERARGSGSSSSYSCRTWTAVLVLVERQSCRARTLRNQ
jgi:hypothetical protein